MFWKFLKPSFLINLTEKGLHIFTFILIQLFILILLLCFYNIIGDIQQKENFKIFYVHVPCAWLAVSIYCVMVCFSLGFIITSIKFYEVFAYICAKIGFVFSFLTLITGCFWGYCTWGTFWAWDTRLTSSLILCVFYFLIIILKAFFYTNFKNSYLVSFLILIGSINIPILKFSVDWWNTLHQKQTINSFAMLIETSVLIPLLLLLFFYLLYIVIFFFIEFRSVLLHNKLQIYQKFINDNN